MLEKQSSPGKKRSSPQKLASDSRSLGPFSPSPSMSNLNTHSTTTVNINNLPIPVATNLLNSHESQYSHTRHKLVSALRKSSISFSGSVGSISSQHPSAHLPNPNMNPNVRTRNRLKSIQGIDNDPNYSSHYDITKEQVVLLRKNSVVVELGKVYDHLYHQLQQTLLQQVCMFMVQVMLIISKKFPFID